MLDSVSPARVLYATGERADGILSDCPTRSEFQSTPGFAEFNVEKVVLYTAAMA